MAEPENGKLHTLSEISQKTGISMPTLQRYKKLYQSRIPSVGQGRRQRYPDSSLPVFNQIKQENAGKRGRPRKDAAAAAPAAAVAPAGSRRRGRPPVKAAAEPAARRAGGRKKASRRGRPPAAASAAAPAAKPGRRRGRPPGRQKKAAAGGLLTLTEISKQTGISYPTLVRYVKLHSDHLPSEGTGRARRFHPQAVDVFRQLRSESGRGGRRKGAGRRAGSARRAGGGEASGALAKRLKGIEKTQQNLEKRFKGLVKSLQKLFR